MYFYHFQQQKIFHSKCTSSNTQNFRPFQQQFYRKLHQQIRTRIVEVDGEHANHLTTTTSHFWAILS